MGKRMEIGMKRIHLQTVCERDEVLDALTNNARVNEGLSFDEAKGTPTVRMRIGRGGHLHMRCVFIGGHSKDNGFIQGTFFTGRLREGKDGKTQLSGVIVTEPVFHVLLCILLAVAVFQMVSLGGISLTPILLLPFVYILMRGEYRKQEHLRRYILRAVHRLEKTKNTGRDR